MSSAEMPPLWTMWTSPESFWILQVPQTPKLQPFGMLSPAALAAAEHGLGLVAGRRHARLGEDDLGGLRLVGDEVVELGRVGLGLDGEREAFLVVVLHVEAERDQHVAHRLHEGLGAAAVDLALEIVAGDQAEHELVEPAAVAGPDVVGVLLLDDEVQLDRGDARGHQLEPPAADDLGRAAGAADEHDVLAEAAVVEVVRHRRATA